MVYCRKNKGYAIRAHSDPLPHRLPDDVCGNETKISSTSWINHDKRLTQISLVSFLLVEQLHREKSLWKIIMHIEFDLLCIVEILILISFHIVSFVRLSRFRQIAGRVS